MASSLTLSQSRILEDPCETLRNNLAPSSNLTIAWGQFFNLASPNIFFWRTIKIFKCAEELKKFTVNTPKLPPSPQLEHECILGQGR